MGYYTIISEDVNLVLSVDPNKRTTVDAPLVLNTYEDGNADQLWKLSVTDKGLFKISSMSSESSSVLVMSLADSDTGESVVHGQYIANTSYMDEWELIGQTGSTFVAISAEEGHDHDASISDVLTSVQSMGYSSNRTLTDIDSDSCISYMASSEIFYIRSHGYKTYIDVADSEIVGMSDLDKLADDALSNCKLVVYGACMTGNGGDGAANLVNKTVDKGAVTVIGFETDVQCAEVNDWATAFFDALAEGMNVTSACETAESAMGIKYGDSITTNSWHIGGSKTQILK